mmetsp:Transcript_13333/g.20963  ORF Transcript_13333/g.20963 Transcript_13333/m.20963 type:complete len:267 (-) Transcript_13333:267-1067(-)|eukprot:CAMPEP_0117029808 /NCGR_PEP_ID=MMETSP0472-20121206/21544_1 /TAXON_ID=693140 ORGANISM="Tiarina fusus, Strain LIS" /NCGR_SAMPLE_ID=MMETSP0472 /ASSEMBLY_ACC=CAM_ASM_000603 /LENGTH=266 /DNA_ID=CAMNT_0004737659 /DNA_START=92 /DNA_END=892 /DNA_ORIENTATION=+
MASEDPIQQDQTQQRLSPPPWPWIKCVRDITDPLKRNHGNDLNSTMVNEANVELPVELLPWLLLSDRKSAMDVRKLKRHHVTHMLSVHAVAPREEERFRELLQGTGIVHKRVHCDDTEGYDMIGKHWETCLGFLKGVREQSGGRVVIHCVAGINRSGLVACAAHMVLERQPLLVVVRQCVVRRGVALWNRSFQRQLCDLAQKEGLLGPVPEGYDDEPLVDELPGPPPAHFVLGLEAAKSKLASQLESISIKKSKPRAPARSFLGDE